MNGINKFAFSLSVAALIIANSSALAETPADARARMSDENLKNDNTIVNTRDSNNNTVTPFDQSNDKSLLSITTNIRKDLVASKLSTNAKNIKIITTDDGTVSLRGVVDSKNEIESIVSITQKYSGDRMINNELRVK